jgi:octaprenyl-diphosphate synthase
MVDVGSLRVMRILADATNRIAEGEVLQLLNVHDPSVTEQRYMQVVERKTATLFEAAARIGAVLSGVDADTEDKCARYGASLGRAFQIIDDVLDLDGGETGKEKGNDVRNGVSTLPILLARAATDSESVSLVARIDAAIESNNAERFAGLMDELRGSRHTAETITSARRWATEAVTALDILPDGLPKKSLARFASRVIDRTN